MMSHSELVRNVRRLATPTPREDKDINPELIHRIKTYIGDTSNGPVANRLSYHERVRDIKTYGTLVMPKKTDTKMEIMIAILKVKGFTSKSIAENSEALFGVKLSRENVDAGYKRVLWKKYNRDKFINRVFNHEDKIN